MQPRIDTRTGAIFPKGALDATSCRLYGAISVPCVDLLPDGTEALRQCASRPFPNGTKSAKNFNGNLHNHTLTPPK